MWNDHFLNLSLSRASGKCRPGMVERNLLVRDHVCVFPLHRENHRQENIRYYARKFFFNRQKLTLGLNACKKEFVWRQIDSYDYVCVTRESRDATKRQNDVDRQRRSQSRNCIEGFVHRNAFSSDDICVDVEEQRQIQYDNNSTKFRYEFYGFFNGADKVE